MQYTTKLNTSSLENRYVGKIFKSEENYIEKYPHEKLTLLIKSTAPSIGETQLRQIEIHCSLYSGSNVFYAKDVFANTSNIKVYFMDKTDCVEMYIQVPQYYKCMIDVISIDNPSMISFVRLSNKTITDLTGAILPTQSLDTIEVPYTLQANMSVSARSQSLNKLFYNHKTKMLYGELSIANGTTGVALPIVAIPCYANQSLSAYKTSNMIGFRFDGTDVIPINIGYDTTNNYFTATLPSGTTRLTISFNLYLKEGYK